MSEPELIQRRDEIPQVPRMTAPQPRAAGAPLSTGGNGHQPFGAQQGSGNRLTSIPASNRALQAPASAEDSTGMQRAMNIFRAALPIVQKLLPLIDGNVGTAVANLITHRSHPQIAAPAPKVDLAPLEGSLAELQKQQGNLREQVMEQNTSLKRVEDRLESVREATDRNTLEQQELLEDLRTFSNKIKVVAVIVVGLLAVGVLLNLIMFFHLQRVLP